MVFTLEALYLGTPKSEEEIQADIEAPAGKAGKDKGLALLDAAEAYRIREDAQQAFTTVKEALAIFREQGADELEALGLCLVARVRMGGAYGLEALQAAKKALKLYKELGDTKGQAVASYMAALVHEAAPSPEDAAWKATEARKLFKEVGDKLGEAVALETMARCHFTQQDFAKGLPAAQDAVAIFRDLGQGQKEAASMCVLSKMHLGRGELEMALQFSKDAMSKLEDLGVPMGEALDIAMNTYLKMGAKDDAAFTAQQEVQRLRTIGEPKEEAVVLLKLAEMHMKLNKPDQAAGPAQEAARAYRSCADKVGEATALVLSGDIKFAQLEKKEAEQLAEEALNLAKDAGTAGLDVTLDAIKLSAMVKASSRKFDKAFDQCVQAMNTYQGMGIPKGQAAMMIVISDLQVKVGDQGGALNTLSGTIPLFTQAGAQKELASASIKLAQMQYKRGQIQSALSTAESALVLYRKLCDNEGKAVAAQLVATAHFGLSYKGNALEARKAAQEAVEVFQKLMEKEAEANALNLLANAHLMNQSFAEAQRTARKAEAIFRDLDDMDGQAGALLLVAGSHLGEGEFAEAKDVGKEARQLFQDANNGKGEDGADEFLDALKQYESGALNQKDFMGFTMTSGEPVERTKAAKSKAKEKKKDTAILSNVDLFVSGFKGEKHSVTFFESFEARRATAPTRGPAARRASEAAAAGQEEEQAKVAADPVTFAIRLMPNVIEGEEVKEKKPKYELVDIEDKRINVSMDLGQPNPKFPGNTGKTNRMFSAMGSPDLL